MAYIPTIPQSGDNLSTSQGQILGNFTALNTEFALNHLAWDAANGGLHTKIDFPTPQGSDPALTGSGDGSVMYAKDVSAIAQMFFRNSAGVQQISGATVQAATSGGVDFPFGLSIRWGSTSFSATSATISYATPFPNNAFIVNISPRTQNSSSHAPSADTINKATFSVLATSTSPTRIAYIAIGN